MDERLLLANCLTLIYQESRLATFESRNLILSILDGIQITEISLGVSSANETVQTLKTTVLELCNTDLDDPYDKATLLQRIKINTGNDYHLYNAIEAALTDLDPQTTRTQVVSLRRMLNNHLKEKKITDTLHKASTAFKWHRDKISNVDEFLNEHISALEPLKGSNRKDPAMITDICLSNVSAVEGLMQESIGVFSGDNAYLCGWQDVNSALNDIGFVRGYTYFINGLEHKNKTGFTLSLFAQIAVYNSPKSGGVKPTLLWVSFEDSTRMNLMTLYQYLIYAEQKVTIDIEYLLEDPARVQAASQYVHETLTKTGFTVKLMHVDGSKWSYRAFIDKVLELEADGHTIEVVACDYLAKMSRAGCTAGASGDDMKDLLYRMRTFFADKRITFITPHQLNPDARRLIRDPSSEADFVKRVAGKGYTEICSSLSQVYDGDLFIHLFESNKKTYFTIQRYKHRNLPAIPEYRKYMIYEFPESAPIPPDVGRERISFRKIASSFANADESLFSI